MRQPTLHITFDNLEKILSIKLTEDQKQLLYDARINPRVLIKGKLSSNVNASKWVNKVNFYLDAILKSKDFKYVQLIYQGSPQWGILNKLAHDIEEFSILYSLSFEEACKWYINEGLTILGKRYQLSKFNYYKTQLFQRYRQKLDFDNDINPKVTEVIYQHYQNKAKVKVDLDVNFVYAAEEIVKLSEIVDPIEYINAQFEQMKNIGVPEPYQLYGENAILRYKSYMRNVGTQVPKSLLLAKEKLSKLHEDNSKK